jgi:hypothetical protein
MPGLKRTLTATWLLLLLLGVAALPACLDASGSKSSYDPSALKFPQPRQKITLRLLDQRDNPLGGAQVMLTPLAGRAQGSGPYRTNHKGEVTFIWLPQAKEAFGGKKLRDRNITYHTKLRYKVEQPGFLPAGGELERKDHARIMASAELKALNQTAKIRPMVRVVVIPRQTRIWGRGLRKLPDSHPVKARLSLYHHQLARLAPYLGARLAVPAFEMHKGRLEINFDWHDSAWAGLEVTPIWAQVVICSGLPLAIACSEDLLPMPQVMQMQLIFNCQAPDPKDQGAEPNRLRVTIGASAGDLLSLAGGKITPEDFMLLNPVQRKILQ